MRTLRSILPVWRGVWLGGALLGGVLAAPGAPAREAAQPPAADAPRAPDLRGDDWINSVPLTPARLRGKVVLVEFWTFDCINCQRTIPAMRQLHTRFGGAGDVIVVGVHTPELPNERDPRAVRRAVARRQISYPVLIDNAMVNWRAFGNEYWPSLYVIDRRGKIRDLHIGELHQDTPAWRSIVALIESLRREPA